MIENLAPVALFVYDRLDTLQKTIHALKANVLAKQTHLFIFSDGSKDEQSWEKVNELRKYLRTIVGFSQVTIIERAVNFYIERNIIDGVTEVMNKFDRVIVLEDDVCVTPYYLKYMNDALEYYEGNDKVMHIAGTSYFDMECKHDVFFSPYMECGWGWGTWKNRWMHFKHYTSYEEALENLSEADLQRIEYDGRFQCLKTLNRTPIPWDICWYLTIYKHNGLCVFPSKMIAENLGLYNGTHFRIGKIFGKSSFEKASIAYEIRDFDCPIEMDDKIEEVIGAFHKHIYHYNLLGKVVRYVHQKMKKHE